MGNCLEANFGKKIDIFRDFQILKQRYHYELRTSGNVESIMHFLIPNSTISQHYLSNIFFLLEFTEPQPIRY